MTQPQLPTERTQDRIEAFLTRFFGPGNDAWPAMDPDYPWKDRTLPFVDMLRRGADAPVVLPRMDKARDLFTMYVIARDPLDVAKTADLITAFAGPTYIADGGVRAARLDPDDPVDQAVLDFAGPGVTFTVRTGAHRQHRTNLADALQLMQRTVARRPPRLWRVAKPVGRLLAEFDAALAAGGEAASADLLEQLAAGGGIDATNLAYLEIKRLSRLGRNDEILALPRLADVARQDPPNPVRDAILGAVYSTALEEPLTREDIQEARTQLIASGRFVPNLLQADAQQLSSEAITVLLLAAAMRNEPSVLEHLTAVVGATEKNADIPPPVWDYAIRVMRDASGLPAETLPRPGPPDAVTTVTPGKPSSSADVVDSWPALITAIAEDRHEGQTILDERSWATWPGPATNDENTAQLLDSLESEPANRVWGAVGAFIDAVGYAAPAGRSAHAFIRNALTFDRYGPGDLVALHALTDITLRHAPGPQEYAKLLDDIRSECNRWVAPERASIALDFIDVLVLAPCPDPVARGNLAYALIDPLWQHQIRLDEADRAFARRLSEELTLGFTWPEPSSTSEEYLPLTAIPQLNVLLYSLDEAVLARSADELAHLAPTAKVVTAYDHVGSTQLRQKARHADVIVMATRCAKHAATGFITQHAGNAQIEYAEGSGSASLLRATVTGLRTKVRRT